MTRLLLRVLALLALCGHAVPVPAHEPTFSQIEIRLGARSTDAAVVLPVATLLHELAETARSPLPAGTTEAALRSAPLAPALEAALAGLVTDRLRLSSDRGALPLAVTDVAASAHEILVTATAPPAPGGLEIDADLFPQDRSHRAFVEVWRSDGLAGRWTLEAGETSLTVGASLQPLRQVVAEFLYEGVRHIFIGPDHILFILALILLGGGLWAQVKIVTAFTLAHSVTLTLATLGVVTLPARLVESVIALSIVVVGLHDLRRIGQERAGADAAARRDPRPLYALGFGLIHGFGFAGVLAELGLPREALASALAAFNVGVELGQVAIVLVAAPILLLLRRAAPPLVARSLLAGLSGAVVLIGGLWFCERATGA